MDADLHLPGLLRKHESKHALFRAFLQCGTEQCFNAFLPCDTVKDFYSKTLAENTQSHGLPHRSTPDGKEEFPPANLCPATQGMTTITIIFNLGSVSVKIILMNIICFTVINPLP